MQASWCLPGFGILLCLATLKFFTEHKFTSANSGFEAAMAQPQLDLLLIGSSHTRKSYDVQMLEQATGIHSLFLVSYDGIDMTSMSQMLDTMASRPGRCPRHVVVEAYGAMLGRRPDLEDPRFFAEAPPSMKLEILRSYVAGRSYSSAILDAFDLIVNRGNDEIAAFPFYAWAEKIDSYKGGRVGFSFPGMTAEQFQHLKASYNAATPNPDQVSGSQPHHGSGHQPPNRTCLRRYSHARAGFFQPGHCVSAQGSQRYGHRARLSLHRRQSGFSGRRPIAFYRQQSSVLERARGIYCEELRFRSRHGSPEIRSPLSAKLS